MFTVPMTDFIAGETRTPMLVLLGAVGFVLLIACSNIAGLMLARTANRAREIAVRAALGGRGLQLFRQTIAESLLLVSAGALLGIALAWAGMLLLLLIAPPDAVVGLDVRIDLHVLLFTALAATISGILFAVAPSWQASRMAPHEQLKGSGRSATGGRGRQRLRAALVVAETALALVLLVGAGLLLRSVARLQDVYPGFEPRGVMTATLSLPEGQYDTAEKRIAFYRALTDQLATVPGVTTAAAGAPLPFSGSGASASFSIEGRPSGPGDPGPHGNLRAVTPGYFKALGIPLKSGRLFVPQDRSDTEPVVIIDQNLARQYWPNENPVGKHMRRGSNAPWSTIVGVVGHVSHSDLASDTGKGTYYYCLFQFPIPWTSIVVKAKRDPSGLGTAIRDAVLAVDPTQALRDVKSMEDLVSGSLAPRRFVARLLAFFAVVAVFMAALGLYGVISYSVVQRTQEIGIRMALGARAGSVLRMVVGRGLVLSGTGVAVGLIASMMCSRLLASQLYQVSPFDPATFGSMVIALLAAALLAAYVPARRAMKVDPLKALRYE
jgi:predicted permease